MRHRITKLEPLGSCTLLILLLHAAMIAGAWWWLRKSSPSVRDGNPADLRWFAPSDMATPKARPAPAALVTASHAAQEPAAPAPPPAIHFRDQPGSRAGASSTPEPSPAMRPYVPPGQRPRMEIILARAPKPADHRGDSRLPGDPPSRVSLPDALTLSSSSTPPPKTQGTVAGESGMDAVDQAIIDAFRQNWTLPAEIHPNGDQITVQLDVSIARDGRILDYHLVKPSKNTKVDMSALQAASLIKKIAVGLPADFSGDRYEVQMHFHLE